jgi:hypothetical protein
VKGEEGSESSEYYVEKLFSKKIERKYIWERESLRGPWEWVG